MKISKDVIERFESEFPHYIIEFSLSSSEISVGYDEFVQKYGTIENASIISISGFDNDQFINRTIRTTKSKEITYQYIVDRMYPMKHYENLTNVFKNLLPHNGVRFYATTYGIGFDTFNLSEKEINESTKDLKDYLKKIGIRFRNEYSKAYWIYRFIISKSEKNIEIMKTCKN